MKLSSEQIADPQSGIFLVNKPKEWTSHDVVNFVRNRFKFQKVGHCGTLDPNATGLLILVVGNATKIADFFSGEDKVYHTTMKLGKETASHDGDGEITGEAPWQHLTEEKVREVMMSFAGQQQQTPPMVSAVKVNGKKLYELARKGVEIQRESRPITIHSITIDKVNLPEILFTVKCSKGTYVRTLCHDMGKALGTCAYMSDLTRTESGGFSIKNSFALEEVKAWQKENFLKNMISLSEYLTTKALKNNI